MCGMRMNPFYLAFRLRELCLDALAQRS
eukprot:COSAG02_NODE_32626_length_513_cov_0.855072_1_plen_27_part_10